MCSVAGVSRSGYYRYHSKGSEKSRRNRDEKDEVARDNILKAYKFKNIKKGARQIKMTLEGHYGVVYNLKRIRRVMKKYNIFCPIRKANPYRRMMKATREHTVVPNLLNRQFKQKIPGKVLLTDITYLFYGSNKKADLSTIKDGSTNQILAYNVSTNLEMPLATDTLHKLKKSGVTLHKEAFIHSDQGAHVRQEVA